MADFGLAKQIIQDNLSFTADTGAQLFRAPETASTYYGLPADVWSFGIFLSCLFEHDLDESVTMDDPIPKIYMDMMSRSHLEYSASTKKQAYQKVASSPFKDLTLKCLSWEPASRPSFTMIRDDLAKIEETQDIERFRQFPPGMRRI